MLELGKPGSAAVEKNAVPVLHDGALVATLRAANWREAATAVVGDRRWEFAKRGRELTARWATEPEDAARFRARPRSVWKGTWTVDLGGTVLEVRTASIWKGTHRFLADGRTVAESGSTGFWGQRPTLTADDSVSLDGQVFLLWLESVFRRRASSAAVGSVAATGAIG
jgi:hypothetical protein